MNRLIVISAPSGTGKTTLCAKLLQEVPELMLSISTTTRVPRGKEQHGVEYFFTTQEDFKKKISENGFAEWALVHGNYYGTSNAFIHQAFGNGKSLLLDIDVQGADSLRKSYPKETVSIFIQPPNHEELERRLRTRGTDSEETIAKRMRAASQEIEQAKHFDHVIMNDQFDRAYLELAGIVLHAVRGTQIARGTP